MRLVLEVKERLRALFFKERLERELDEELQFHLDALIERNVALGMNPQEARAAALRNFGGIERAKEGVRAEWGVRALEELVYDVRHALRGFRRRPAFTAVAVCTLALGIGANTAIFSVVQAVLLRPLPYHDPDRLVLLWGRTADGGARDKPIAAPDVVAFRERTRLFEGFAFTDRVDEAALTEGSEPEHIRVGQVSPNFFRLLGVQPINGRGLGPEDILPGGVLDDSLLPPVPLLLSHGLWDRRFGRDPDVVGLATTVNGQTALVAGVLPEGFELLLPPDVGIPSRVDAWAPIRVELSRFTRVARLTDQDSDNTGAVIGRLRPGVSLAQAQAEMDAIAASLREEVPAYREAGVNFIVRPLREDVLEHVRPFLLALAGAVGLVLLITCINVASLQLVRTIGRRRELALRSVLGARGVRLLRQLITESVVLALTGGLIGLLVARLGIMLLTSLGPTNLPRLGTVRIDGPVLTFTLVASLAAALIFGAAPALYVSRRSAAGLLKQHGADNVSRAGRRLRGALVAGQVALSLVLLLSAGLLFRSLLELQHVHPGFDSKGILAFNISLRYAGRYQGPADRARFVRQLEERIAALPGVEGVGLVGRLPLSGRIWSQPFGLEGQSQDAWNRNEADFRMISSGYLPAMGTRLMAGRYFNGAEDLFEHQRVAIVDEKLARRVAPTGNAVGKRIGFPLDGAPVWAEIVGVVEHVRHDNLQEEGRETIYVPYRQEASRDVAIVVKTSGEPGVLTEAVRRAVRALAPQLPIYNVRRMDDYVAAALAPTRFSLALIGVFAGLAMLLASVGLYGVVSYSVSQRTQEIGVRMALGASGGRLVKQLVGDGLLLTAFGLVTGLTLSVAASQALTSLVYGVSRTDPLTYAAVTLLLVAVTSVACLLPARRASRVDPVVALRVE